MKSFKPLFKVRLRLLALLLCLAAAIPQLMAYDYTIYMRYTGSGSASDVTMHAWGNGISSNWPGFTMTSTTINGVTYYVKTLSSSDASIGVIFSMNGSPQTPDLTAYAGDNYFVYDGSTTARTYHVLGEPADLFGQYWSKSSAGQMVDNGNGTWTWTKTADLTSGTTYKYKVNSNSNQWYPSGNDKTFTVATSGSYTVTITFDGTNVSHAITSNTPTTPDYYITGDNGLGLGGFSYQNLTTMTYDDVNEVYSYTHNVTAAGTYYFAFADGPGNDWNDFNNNHRYGPASGNQTVTLGNWATTQHGTGSYAMTVDAGQVTITFDVANMRYKVEGTEPVIAVDYYVKGADTSIFPDGWSTTSNTAQMTETDNDSGIYTWTSGEFHANAGSSYTYKVYGSDGIWHPLNSGNQTVSAEASGTYTVTVTYDSNNETVSAVLNPIQLDPTYDYDIYVRYTGSEPVSNVFIYAWDNNGTLSDAWNGNTGGTALSSLSSEVINGHTYYKVSYTSYSSTINVIFNENGSSQTANLTANPGDNYFTYGGGNTVDGPNDAADAATVYYVVGENTSIFPNGWNTGSETLMTNDNGTYTWTASNVHLDAGTTYTYKVLGSNNSSYPANGEASFSVDASGTYNVVFTFDGTNVNAVPTLVQADPIYTYDIYVRYTGSEPVGNVFIYAWDAAGDLSAAWSGTALSSLTSQVINGHTYYHVTYTSYSSTINVIFNENGSSQTADLTAEPGDNYYTYGGGNTVDGPNNTADPAIVYYIVGDANVFPNGWNTGDGTALTDNGNGTYSWSSTNNVHLNVGTDYVFKVLSSEGVYYPTGDNESFSVNTPGTYSISVSFDGTTPVVTPTLVQADAMAFSVVGSKELFGGDEDWTNHLSMTDDGDGTYSWDSQDLILTAGTYYFKVNDNYGGWYGTDGSDNGDNIEVNVAANGTYRLHIDFDGSNAPTYTLVRVDISTIYITGSESLGLGWSSAPTTTMTYDVETGLYSYSFDVVNAGTHGFVFATGQGSGQDEGAAWYDFNTNYRVGPTNGNENVTLNGDWAQTQPAGGDNGAYMVTTGVGKYTIYYDPTNVKYKVVGPAPIFIMGDLGLGLGWSYAPSTAMAYNDSTGLYSYTYRIPNQGTYSFVFANGQATGFEEDHDAAWNYFNTNYRIGPTNGDQTVTIGQWENTQAAGADNGAYSVRLAAGYVTIYFDNSTSPMRFKVESSGELGDDLYMVGTMTYDNVTYHYSPDQGILMKYDNAKKLYYLNHVTINTNSTFCFSTSLGSSSDDWVGMGTRYGNDDNDPNYFVAHDGDATAHLRVTGDKINVNMPLAVWDEDLGEWMMNTAGIYNVIVNLEDGWVKLIKTDQFSLFPMNVYLQQTNNVEMNPGAIGHTYNVTDDGSNPWPLIAWNRLEGDWNPQENDGANHYAVTYMGDTTTTDGKTWWHWQVSASIAEIIFTRTNMEPYQSETIARKAGVLWYTWEEDNTMTAHSREYFTSSATALPGNVVVEEGHYYVYFINTVGWETVNCVAWSYSSSPYYDGHGKDVQTWPGQTMTCIGIDPMTGYEVWEYDFGAIDDSMAPDDLLFHDGTPIATTDAKEQTGDFDFINGGVYDYLGLFDDAYTLNSLIRTAEKNVRYTISNDLLGVYYDANAETDITYELSNGSYTTERVFGALYAKDLNDYGEKSEKPKDDEFVDYVYEVCGGAGDDSRPSQIMDKEKEYDQSNWIKLVVSPNYDGGTPLPAAHPELKDYVGHIIPGKTLQLYMTDSINPTGRVMAIQLGEAMSYNPNVYVAGHFNDTVVFNYTHREWQPDVYKGNYRTRPYITWHLNNQGNAVYGEVTRERIDEDPVKMFYVAPKPQEIAYITWVVYDNNNEPWTEGGTPPYGNYVSGVYQPYTIEGLSLPKDPGRFYAPSNWDRSITINYSYLEQLVAEGKMTQAELQSLLTDGYLSDNQLDNIAGGFGQQYGPYSNGYMQCGGIQVNWSLFDELQSGNKAWWQIFRPGQAYKFKAIIRYARGSEGDDSADNYYYGPSNGGQEPGDGSVLSAPRRDGVEQNYNPNMYFTGNYENLNKSKFIIFPIEASAAGSNGSSMGNVTDVEEIIQDLPSSRTITSVRYYNLTGIESDKPFDGINIVVTTYSDGSRSSMKILR